MPYTAAQLTTIYTNIHAGLAPNEAQKALLNAIASQNNAGTLSDADALQRVIDTADADSAVAISAYQFFTGTAPSAAGLAFLVNSTTNTTDLNDAYYTNFNQTNRYINFAANLGTGAGAGAAGFSAAYGALTFSQAVDLAYETVIGTNNATQAGIDPNAGKAYIVSQLPYFTALANQNFPTATAAQKDLIIKAEMVGYIMSEAMKANLGTYANATAALLGDLGPDNTATLGADLLASYAAGSVTLTSGVDIRTGNVFTAPRVFTPGGTDQINSLNDDDVLTGAGTNPTLNFTFVNDADTGDNDVVPTLNNIQTVNVAFAGDANMTFDAQDSTGIKAFNITRVDDDVTFARVTNLQSVPANLSVSNTNAPATTIEFSFSDSAAGGPADATTLTASNVQVATLIVEETGAGADQGVETLTLVSTGNANKIGTLQAEDLKSLIITGGQKLTLGTQTNVVNAAQTEAVRYGAGLANVAGSLTSVDASAMTAALDISLGGEVTANLEDTSGTPVNFTVKGGAGDDMIRLLNGLDGKADTIDGGAGTNTVQVYASVAVGSVTNVQKLDVRAGQDAGTAADTITVDTSLFPQLASINVRNEGQSLVGGVWTPAGLVDVLPGPGDGKWDAEAATINLTKLTVATATAITVMHGTTGSNGIAGADPAGTGGTTIVATLATDTASDTVGVTIANGVNTDPRSNFNLTAGTAVGGTNVVENVTITDSDTESNSVRLTNVAAHTGTLTLNGGQVGNFLNLDTFQTAAASPGGATSKDLSGLATGDIKAWVDSSAATTAVERIVATTIAGGSFVGDLILRVGNPAGATGAQSITTGSGNDTVIFDVITGVGQSTAGLSISDTVAAGAGTDALVLDGNGVAITVGASEWTNVTGFEQLRLIGNGVASNNGFGAVNAYNVTLTNNFITANNTTSGGIQRIAIINDNDPGNDAKGVATAGASANTGVTIDARTLDATHSFSYDGNEAAAATADRFIMTDANINGAAIIDGGYAAFNTKAANADVLEVRNAAVVTIGDLANVKNVGTIQFTNDTAAPQASILQLDTTTIDALVNSTHTSKAGDVETLTIQIQGNTILGAATTAVTIDTSSVDFSLVNVVVDLQNPGASKSIVTTNGGAQIANFTSGTDAFDYNGTLFNGTTTAATLVSTLAPTAVANNTQATANDAIFTFSGAGDLLAAGTTAATAVANAVTALTSGADFSGANIIAGDHLLLLMSDGTNTWLFDYVAQGVANVTEAADLTLIGEFTNILPVGFAAGERYSEQQWVGIQRY
jgi:hypothetical protein